MPLESTQILSIVAREYAKPEYYDYIHSITYDPVHRSHPSVLWTLEGLNNFQWLLQHTESMFDRIHGLGKTHKSYDVFKNIYNALYDDKLDLHKFITSANTKPLLAMGRKNEKPKEDEYLDIKLKFAVKTEKGWRSNSWIDATKAYQEYIRRKVFLPISKEAKAKGYLRLPSWHEDMSIPTWYTASSCTLQFRK